MHQSNLPLECDHVFGALAIDEIDERGDQRRLAAGARPGDEHEALRLGGEAPGLRATVRVVPRWPHASRSSAATRRDRDGRRTWCSGCGRRLRTRRSTRSLRRCRSIPGPVSGAISRIALSTSARDSGDSDSRNRRSPSTRIHGRDSDVRNNADAPRAAATRSRRSNLAAARRRMSTSRCVRGGTSMRTVRVIGRTWPGSGTCGVGSTRSMAFGFTRLSRFKAFNAFNRFKAFSRFNGFNAFGFTRLSRFKAFNRFKAFKGFNRLNGRNFVSGLDFVRRVNFLNRLNLMNRLSFEPLEPDEPLELLEQLEPDEPLELLELEPDEPPELRRIRWSAAAGRVSSSGSSANLPATARSRCFARRGDLSAPVLRVGGSRDYGRLRRLRQASATAESPSSTTCGSSARGSTIGVAAIGGSPIGADRGRHRRSSMTVRSARRSRHRRFDRDGSIGSIERIGTSIDTTAIRLDRCRHRRFDRFDGFDRLIAATSALRSIRRFRSAIAAAIGSGPRISSSAATASASALAIIGGMSSATASTSSIDGGGTISTY